MDDEVTIGFYSPSYKRSQACNIHNIIPGITYVVRKSEEEEYKKIKGCNVLSVEDELINSGTKAKNWIIKNTPEDIVVEFDDDIEKFVYRTTRIFPLEGETLLDEIYRLCQIQYDLKIGLGGAGGLMALYNYTDEFKFNKIVGPFLIINKECYKAQSDINAKYNEDIDRTLQELLLNRIVLYPNYMCVQFQMDTNAGGDSVTKTTKEIKKVHEYMNSKWGKYFNYNKNTNTVKINVKR